jgi:DNA polymerase epsilon subunit 2
MEETTSLFEHLAMTPAGSSLPPPHNVQPIYWDFDHALRLYSSPHAVRPLNGEQVRQL